MPGLDSLMNDLPEGLQTDGAATVTDDEEGDDTTDTDDTQDSQDGASEDDQDDTDEGDDTTDDAADDEEDGNDDYFTATDDEEETPKPVSSTSTAQPELTDENTYILQNLSKIAVRIIMPGADGKDEVKQVEVYGYGDLPRDFKGFATEYERGTFNQAVMAQEQRAQGLQTEFRQKKVQADTEAYVQRENKMIADDLTELRQEGIFPKFKGVPGSKEFNDSAGAKEFDRVIAFMNEKNDDYGKAAQSGKAFRHIGFREAFVMLNGPDIKARQQQESKSRKAIAGKLKSGGGTKAGKQNVKQSRVTNITDLEEEFANFAGGAS